MKKIFVTILLLLRWCKSIGISNGTNCRCFKIKGNSVFTNCAFKDDVFMHVFHKEIGYTFIANFQGNVVFEDSSTLKRSEL